MFFDTALNACQAEHKLQLAAASDVSLDSPRRRGIRGTCGIHLRMRTAISVDYSELRRKRGCAATIPPCCRINFKQVSRSEAKSARDEGGTLLTDKSQRPQKFRGSQQDFRRMRKLFVPACVCLVALSGSTGNDPKVSLVPFTSGQTGEATPIDSGKARPAATSGQATEQAHEDVNTRSETDLAVATIDRPVAIPSQSDGTQALTRLEPAPLPKPKPEIKPVIYRPRDEVCDILTRAAQHNGLPVPFFIRLLFQESGFSPGVVSNAGAQGIAQFMPDTATEWGVDNPFDPLEAIPASARLLRNLFEKFGNLGLAAAAYNAGPKRIQDWLAKKGALPQETQGYVKNITGRQAENWKGSENGAPAVKLPRHAPCQEAAGLLAWNGPDEIPTPVTAPNRRPKEPVVVATVGDAAAKRIEAKTDVKVTRQGGRVTAAIKVADASGGLPKAKSKGDESKSSAKNDNDRKRLAGGGNARKTVAKTKDGKEALQLAARKQSKKDKKLRVSQR